MFAAKNENGKEKVVAATINLIGEGTNINGDLDSSGDVRIDGKVKGNIKSRAKVVIGPQGIVDGNITCNNADISGTVVGNLTIKGLLFLKGTANVEGDIISTKLVVEPGARFNGTSRMGVTKEIGHEEEFPAKLKKSLI